MYPALAIRDHIIPSSTSTFCNLSGLLYRDRATGLHIRSCLLSPPTCNRTPFCYPNLGCKVLAFLGHLPTLICSEVQVTHIRFRLFTLRHAHWLKLRNEVKASMASFIATHNPHVQSISIHPLASALVPFWQRFRASGPTVHNQLIHSFPFNSDLILFEFG